jgi:AraC family transcriptional regulator, ethanolamine operon transcriptional activator
MRTADVECHLSCQPGWGLDYEQLSAGSFEGSIDHVCLPGLSLVRESANCAVRQRGEMTQSGYGFAVPVRLDDEALFNGQRWSLDCVAVGPSNDLELSCPASFLLMGVVVDAGLIGMLHRKIFGRDLSSWLNQQVVVQLQPQAATRLRGALQQAFDAVEAAPKLLDDRTACDQLRDAILSEWLAVLPLDVDTGDLKLVGARRRVVDRACSLILAQRDEPISLLELCGRIGVSESKLNYCFQDVLGISPGRYLKAVRLNHVRRELRRCRDRGIGVQDIAAHWGFWHLGQFSSDYKRQFAELPSQTLRAARRA